MGKIFNVLTEVLKDKELTYLDKCVLVSLITFNGRGKIYPSIKEIGKRINCGSRNNISVSLNKLKKKGYIQIIRRFQKSNYYLINEIENKMKTNKSVLPAEIKEKTQDQLIYMNKAMIDVVSGEIAKANGRSFPESADYAFVCSLLKEKKDDRYKDDSFNEVRKCLMLLYLINKHFDKFTGSNTPYPYFKKVYSLSSYEDVKSKIFGDNFPKQVKPDKNIINNPSINY